MHRDEDALENTLTGPVLRAAEALQSLGEVRPSDAASRRIVLALRMANAQAGMAKQRGPVYWRQPAIALALASSAVISIGLTSVYAAGDALPGSPLYPVRGLREHVQIALASSSAERARLYVSFAAARTHQLHEKATRNEELAPADMASLLKDVGTLSHDASQESRSADPETQLTVTATEEAVTDELLQTEQEGSLSLDENVELEQTVQSVAAAKADVIESTATPEATPDVTPEATPEATAMATPTPEAGSESTP